MALMCAGFTGDDQSPMSPDLAVDFILSAESKINDSELVNKGESLHP
jgi:hypothetical protein